MFEIASDVSLIVFGAYICVSDIRFHRIPNLSLLFLTCALIPSIKLLSFTWILSLIIALWALGFVAKIGPGDLKLLTILIIMNGEIILNSLMWIIFTLISALSIVIHTLARRSVRGEIPLAPAIVIPFTALYLSF